MAALIITIIRNSMIINQLPRELLDLTFHQADSQTLLSLRRVNHIFNQIATPILFEKKDELAKRFQKKLLQESIDTNCIQDVNLILKTIKNPNFSTMDRLN